MARAALRGRKRFSLKLRALKPAVRKEIEAATGINATLVAALAQRWAPERDGDLKASTKAEKYSDGPAIRWRVVSGDADAFYARFVEFNHRPYFFPAYRALRRQCKARLRRAFRKAKAKVFS